MSGSAVIFEGVWKKFRRGERHDSLRDLIPALLKGFVGRKAVELERGEFWALKEISFEVYPGQALGIIGPNGAGKSTILKLLTKILKPTRGRCEVRGRVGALIEVAAGFHPDLTGRENIYLQGAIMGMKGVDIARKFEQIVEFSGIADFIDTQVKRYSSGMNARLGFAIAAHLDPDVLLIDEVLAVGDFAFQQKAFARIEEIVRREIPVIVVSHQLDRIASLCSHAILLDGGALVRYGSAAECVAAYINSQNDFTLVKQTDCPVQLRSLTLTPQDCVRSGERLQLVLMGEMLETGIRPLEGVTIRIRSNSTGQILFATNNARCGVALPLRGPFELALDLQMNVAKGIYTVETLVWDRERGRELAQGPHTCVQVQDSLPFFGIVQMNPCMTLRRPRCGESVKTTTFSENSVTLE